MVRLVFRPYTQVRRTICTSVSLRASTRVSPGFTLLRHSSPSFGSQRSCSCASSILGTMGPIVHGAPGGSDPTSAVRDRLRFRYAQWFATRALAWTLDSLVRVSRRVGSDHFVSVPNTHMGLPANDQRNKPGNACITRPWPARTGGTSAPRGACFEFLNQGQSREPGL